MNLLIPEIQKTYPAFDGFNGVSGDYSPIGITEAQCQAELDSINIETLKENDPRRKVKKKVRKKLKALGLDDEDLATMGLSNDIPDEV